MNRKQAEQLLKENGFLFKRQAHHGELWEDSDGKTLLLGAQVGRSKGADRHSERNFEADVRRIVKQRLIKASGHTAVAELAQKETQMAYEQNYIKRSAPLTAPLLDMAEIRQSRQATLPPGLKPASPPASPAPAPKRHKSDEIRKFKSPARYIVWRWIELFRNQGKTPSQTAYELKQLGLLRSNGDAIGLDYIEYTLNHLPAPLPGVTAPETKVVTVEKLVEKIVTVEKFVDRPVERLPALIELILEDNQMPAEAKVGMIRTWAGSLKK